MIADASWPKKIAKSRCHRTVRRRVLGLSGQNCPHQGAPCENLDAMDGSEKEKYDLRLAGRDKVCTWLLYWNHASWT
ncbi:MAG: hypothetical protein ACREDH_13245 [Methylocella sp.]